MICEQYRNPTNARYFFRRLLWANLLSGGHATYGGLRTYEPYDGGPARGVQGYYTANRRGTLAQGAHDYIHIHAFFRDTGLTLVGMEPRDDLVGGNPFQAKCLHKDGVYIVYAANPQGSKPDTDSPRVEKPEVTIQLPEGSYAVRWYNPRMGTWEKERTVSGSGARKLDAPEGERVAYADWVILIREKR